MKTIITPLVLLSAALLLAGCTTVDTNDANNLPPAGTAPIDANATQIKNVDTMHAATGAPISVEADVEYYPGAHGYFAQPAAAGALPAVVMIHENRGLRPEIKSAADALAAEGYMVLAVDLLGATAEDQEGARALTANFNQDTGTANMQAAADWLRKRGATKVASLGWCFGGRQSIALAISGEPLDATVVYYGGNMASTVDALRPIAWPVLGIFGEDDQAIPLEKVEEFRASLTTLDILHEIHIYPGVGHAFANPSGDNYAPEETADAWAKTLAFLNTTLKQ